MTLADAVLQADPMLRATGRMRRQILKCEIRMQHLPSTRFLSYMQSSAHLCLFEAVHPLHSDPHLFQLQRDARRHRALDILMVKTPAEKRSNRSDADTVQA